MDAPELQTPEPERNPASGPAPTPQVGQPEPAQAPDYPARAQPFGKPENAPGIPSDLPNYQKEWQSGEVGAGLAQKPDKWDKVLTGIRGGVDNSFLGTAATYLQTKSAETGTLMPADQANAANPYRATPYTTPVDSGIVAMEAADGRIKQQRQEWLSRNDIGGAGIGNFVGGLTDAPLYMAMGLVTGGLGDLVPGAGMVGAAGRLAAHYGVSLAEFSGAGYAQNKMEVAMGGQEKSFPQIVQENMGGALLATGIGALTRAFKSAKMDTPENIQRGVKENATAMANDEKIPSMDGQRSVLDERRAGTQVDPGGNKITPTLKTSPINETPLYVATHGDGKPLIHEDGLGQGRQFTDTKEVANNGVARSTEVPGQIGETKLPESAKLLDIDKSASEDYGSKDSFLKQVEEKTGVPLDEALKNGESIKDIIQNLGDWAGADLGDGKSVPEDILKQIQDIAKEQGFNGYQFDGENSRTVHMFDPANDGMQVSNVQHADPNVTSELPSTTPETSSNSEAAASQENAKAQNYSPAIQEALNKIRKNAMTLHPDNLTDQIAETTKTLTEHKQLLQQMAKENPEAEAALEDLRDSEKHDARMMDLAKRIINCGATE